MIQYYKKSPYGIGLLTRVNGSAVYRSTIPGLLSAFFSVIFRRLWDTGYSDDDNELRHPYAIGVLIASLTFLLVFRVQQGYARYWEACTTVHHMMSKWMDATQHSAVFHMQCSHYDKIKPPSYFEYPELNGKFLTRSRERQELDESTDTDNLERLHHRSMIKSIEPVPVGRKAPLQKTVSVRKRRRAKGRGSIATSFDDMAIPLEGPARLDGNWGKLFDDGKPTFFNAKHPERKDPRGFASSQGGHTPPLFLQELAHLASLLSAVALSTLRNDIEGAESPLDIYEPGSPWPAVDPGNDSNIHDMGKGASFVQKFLMFIGVGRSAAERTRYNASRPLPVIGGVSEAEIRFLQMARGPYAKTQLVWFWLSELTMREHLAGTMGKIGPPIISRIIQFLGDGMLMYNHARKIMHIPFPFPHAQLSVVYVLVSIPAVALLMDQYAREDWLAALLSFLVVTCLSGIHEVARELENPFRNVPNEIPLVTLQAQFNEALITMYAGYHPDFFWKEEADMILKETRERQKDETTRDDASASVPKADAPKEATSNKSSDTEIMESMKKMAEQLERQSKLLDQQQKEIERLKKLRSSEENDLHEMYGDEKKLE